MAGRPRGNPNIKNWGVKEKWIIAKAAPKKMLKKRADQSVEMLITKYKTSAKEEQLKGKELALEPGEIAAGVVKKLTGLSRKAIHDAAAINFRRAFGFGRNKSNKMFAEKFGKRRYVYSAVFDKNT
jgi:uncharacterized protein (DUF2141 family)